MKKILSLTAILLLVLSSLSFAEDSTILPVMEPSSDESVDESRGDNEERSEKSDGVGIDKEKLREMAKKRMGEKYNDDEFERMMREKSRMMEKGFSAFGDGHEKKGRPGFYYENTAMESQYDLGPSYEGFSDEMKVYGKIFELIGDEIDPREIKSHCQDPQKIADVVIGKLKDKIGGLANICKGMGDFEEQCAERAEKMCSLIGIPHAMADASEDQKVMALANACPVNKDAMLSACKLRMRQYTDQWSKSDMCDKMYADDRVARECGQMTGVKEFCDKDKFMEQCRPKDLPNQCEPKPRPDCEGGLEVREKFTESGCSYFVCEHVCPEIAPTVCSQGEILHEQRDATGCVVGFSCEHQQFSCPAVTPPLCESGTLMTTTDEQGCQGYECREPSTSGLSSVTGNTVAMYPGSAQRPVQREDTCENRWNHQQEFCERASQGCSRDLLIERCKARMASSPVSAVDNCEAQISSQLGAMQQRCDMIVKEREICHENTKKRCEQMQGIGAKCTEYATEEKIREFILREAQKRCKFVGFISDEDKVLKAEKVEIMLAVLNTASADDLKKLGLFVQDLTEQLKLETTTVYKGYSDPRVFNDVKLLPFVVNAKMSVYESSQRSEEVKTAEVADQKVAKAVGKLVSLRDSDIPEEYLYIIEDKASDILDASENVNRLEETETAKGNWYKFMRWLGLKAKQEKQEIEQLRLNANKLEEAVSALRKLQGEVPNDVARAILKEQVENLESQKASLTAMVGDKEKKAEGIL